MTQNIESGRDRITVAILALGGQGGGVLADWIIHLANSNGYIAQGTSVPGVAQRTGSTVYYIEMIRRSAASSNAPPPVLAMMPMPGDVDIVLAAELAESGRAILRGFVTEDRTTLIGSTHRVYAISEKSALADGTASSQRIREAAERRAKRFIGFDMEEASVRARSVISSVLFGALAGSQALPFDREMFEEAIRHGGKAVASNLKGFSDGADLARTRREEIEIASAPPAPTTESGRALADRIARDFDPALHATLLYGVAKLMDYQDRAYANLYLDRAATVAVLDDGRDGRKLSVEAARYLALWMGYEDTIRVADLKIRQTRLQRVEQEVQLKDDQTLRVTEYMHPRLQEVCETMPAAIGRAILARPRLRAWLEPFFRKGRHVETTGLRWHVALRLLASMRGIRRSTLRYRDEQQRIEEWLGLVRATALTDSAAAAEIAMLPKLIKGYSDTFERGLARYQRISAAVPAVLRAPEASDRIAALRAAALADDKGRALDTLLAAEA